MTKKNIYDIPEGHIEGYLLSRASVGFKHPLHYFVIADAYENLVTRYHLPRYLGTVINDYIGEYVQISKHNNKVTITPGGNLND